MTAFTEAKFNKFSEKDRMNRTLEGLAFWTYSNKPKHSDKYNTDTFTISLNLDNPEMIKKAESYGLEVQPADKYNPFPYVEIVRKVRPGKTIDEVRPEVVDAVQQPAKELIGNKSKVLVKFGTYWFGDKVRTTLFKIQILDLVKVPMDNGLKMDETGYKATGTSSEFDA